jgi:hypothetical protein
MRVSLIACAAILAGTAFGAQAATLNITFDGHCDGVDVTYGANGVAYGVETGCESGPAVGTKGSVKGQAKNTYTLNLNHIPNSVFVIRPDHTWSIYLSDGSDLQDGTWTAAADDARPDANLPHTGQR